MVIGKGSLDHLLVLNLRLAAAAHMHGSELAIRQEATVDLIGDALQDEAHLIAFDT